jgi:NAD(P)-dependent dehydrogenase (short-subunit alcohol dehydrogenase family)
MTDGFPTTYGPWALVAGASDGTGAAFAEDLARRGVNVVLIARRRPLLEELAARLDVETRIVGVDVLALVLGATDTPSLRRSLERHGGDFGELADPAAIVGEALDHLADGPTWSYGMPDPTGGSPFGPLPRRQAVELMSLGSAAMFADGES